MPNSIWIIVILTFSMICPSIVSQELESTEKLDKKVERYIKWMERENDLWRASIRLITLGTKAVPYIKEQMAKSSEIVQVGCSKALLSLNEDDYALEVLLRILEDGQNSVARCHSALLLGNYGDYDSDIEKKLLNVMENDFDSQLKIATAKALWQVGKNVQATKTLRQFLSSDKEDLKVSAALALAEIGNVQEVKPILSEIKEEPTWRGRLAQSLLDQERVRSYYERKIRTESNPKNKNPNDGNKNPNDGNKNPVEGLYPTIHEVIKNIREYHINGDKLTEKMLEDEAIRGMVSKTDTFSAFWDEQEYAEFNKSMEKEEYVGIGVYVDKDGEDYIISGLIYGGPAYKAGIRTRDRIIEIAGFPVANATMEDLVGKIRGQIGQILLMKVMRKGWAEPKEIQVVRDRIKIPHVFSQMLPGQIGYIFLTQFGQKATEDIKAQIQTMQADGLNALILDLRGNGGGWLQIAVDIADLFLPEGKLVVYSEGRHHQKGKRYDRRSTPKASVCEVPLAILIDQDSASASEVVAGALQYYKRAIILGQRSFGKGSIQEPIELKTRPNTRLKLTIAMYYLPDGRCIHNEMSPTGKVIKHNGIEPNIYVEKNIEENWKLEEKNRLEAQNVFNTYIAQFYNGNKTLFQNLAVNDRGDAKLYPGFKEWFSTFETKASQDDVRRWLRQKIRNQVMEEIGKEFACDYLEDTVLQQALIELCKKMKIDPNSIEEFQPFIRK